LKPKSKLDFIFLNFRMGIRILKYRWDTRPDLQLIRLYIFKFQNGNSNPEIQMGYQARSAVEMRAGQRHPSHLIPPRHPQIPRY